MLGSSWVAAQLAVSQEGLISMSEWVSIGATYQESTAVLKNRYGNHHLEVAFHAQLRRRVQQPRENLQEFAAAIDHLMPMSTHLNNTSVGKQPVHSPMGYEKET
jgi:hypothetical protein